MTAWKAHLNGPFGQVGDSDYWHGWALQPREERWARMFPDVQDRWDWETSV